MERRQFLQTGIAFGVTLSAPMAHGAAHAKPRVVVIGGGAGGATVARYIVKDSEGMIDVTLIEPSRAYYTCFFSNLYLGGYRKMDDLGHSYGNLAASGINVVHE